MIKRCANKEGVITFNINFESFRPKKSVLKLETGNKLLSSNEKPHIGCQSAKSHLSTPVDDIDENNIVMRYSTQSVLLSDVETEERPRSAGFCRKLFPYYSLNDDNQPISGTDDFLTQEPIDFDELQKFTALDKEEEGESSASTLSKSSKKITKEKAGHVYKESRFKKEAKGKRRPWQQCEDDLVLELVAKHGQSWALIASIMKGRTGKQIRDRFLNNLRPDINNAEWTKEEDESLIRLFQQIGRKWSKIATYLPGRTEGQVKNRFYSYINKKVLPFGTPESHAGSAELITSSPGLNDCYFEAEKEDLEAPQTESHLVKTAINDIEWEFLSQEDKSLYDSTFRSFNVSQNYSPPADPANLISYDDIIETNVPRISPAKCLTLSSFSFPEVGENNLINNSRKETGDSSNFDLYCESLSVAELTEEFKSRCKTGGESREIGSFNNLSNFLAQSHGSIGGSSINNNISKQGQYQRKGSNLY